MSITAVLWRAAHALAVFCLLVAGLPTPGQAAESPRSAALRGVLAAPGNSCGASHLDRRALARFYPGSLPRSLWVDDTGPLPRARRLRAVLERSGDEGLPSTRYGLAAITARWEARTPIEQACLDVLLTTAFDRYGRDLATGIVAPSEADRTWHVPAPAAFDAVAALRAAKADSVARLEALAPKHGLYERLRAGLARYRRLADDGGWETALAGPLLRPGDESDEVRLLRERLRRGGDLDAGAASLDRSYDATLTEAVRSFQRRHGLAQDDVVGPRTLAAFNTPVDTRIAQLRRGMERLRWLPHDLGSHYVFVKIAGFELAVVEDDRTVLTMRVIVGMADQSTPSFAATLRLLTINPYWTVPHRIARDRLVPRERRSPGYLAAHGFRIQDPRTGQWREPDAVPPPPVPPVFELGSSALFLDETLTRWQTEPERAFESVAASFKKEVATIERRAPIGQPGEEIVSTANAVGADLIAVGARGHGTFKRLLLGSVSEYVLHHAECPVLVVRPRR